MGGETGRKAKDAGAESKRGWYHETFDDAVRYGLRVEEVVYEGESEFQKIEVVETARWGRVLVLDGVFNTSEGDERYYHEMLVHPALALAHRIARVLVIGGGDGATVREVLRHGEVEQCVLVELDREVVETSRRFLPQHGTAWSDPRLEVRFLDGASFVRDAEAGSFDAIVVDGTDPVGPGALLFGEPFYRACRRCLRPGGVLATQSESPVLMPDTFVRIQATLRAAFPAVRCCFGPVPIYAAGVWSYTLAGEGLDPRAVDVRRMSKVEADLAYYCREIHAGAFAVPRFVSALLRKAATKNRSHGALDQRSKKDLAGLAAGD